MCHYHRLRYFRTLISVLFSILTDRFSVITIRLFISLGLIIFSNVDVHAHRCTRLLGGFVTISESNAEDDFTPTIRYKQRNDYARTEPSEADRNISRARRDVPLAGGESHPRTFSEEKCSRCV